VTSHYTGVAVRWYLPLSGSEAIQKHRAQSDVPPLLPDDPVAGHSEPRQVVRRPDPRTRRATARGHPSCGNNEPPLKGCVQPAAERNISLLMSRQANPRLAITSPEIVNAEQWSPWSIWCYCLTDARVFVVVNQAAWQAVLVTSGRTSVPPTGRTRTGCPRCLDTPGEDTVARFSHITNPKHNFFVLFLPDLHTSHPNLVRSPYSAEDNACTRG
jgi:hypothetical protein